MLNAEVEVPTFWLGTSHADAVTASELEHHHSFQDLRRLSYQHLRRDRRIPATLLAPRLCHSAPQMQLDALDRMAKPSGLRSPTSPSMACSGLCWPVGSNMDNRRSWHDR